VPYSPLGRGFLTGSFAKSSELEQNDWRRTVPRFDEAHAEANGRIVDVVKRVADRRTATPAQIALAWVLAQGDDVVPIPGTKRRTYLEDNLGAERVTLDATDLRELGELSALVAGGRYTPAGMAMVER